MLPVTPGSAKANPATAAAGTPATTRVTAEPQRSSSKTSQSDNHDGDGQAAA